MNAHSTLVWTLPNGMLLIGCGAARFPRAQTLCKEVEALVVATAASVQLQALPSAAVMLAVATNDAAVLTQLQRWAPAHFLQALTMLAGAQGQHPAVRAYALRSLHTCPPEQVRIQTSPCAC